MAEGELESVSTQCPRCGDVAQIRRSAAGKADVSCPKCGSFEAAWEDFAKTESDAVGSDGQP